MLVAENSNCHIDDNFVVYQTKINLMTRFTIELSVQMFISIQIFKKIYILWCTICVYL